MNGQRPADTLDADRRYVRVRREREDGFIEFDFAIGDPDVFVELVLRRDALADFCAANKVELLPAGTAGGETDDWTWRLADARDTRFR
ncbi:phenol hydroxylase subunit [Zavarzinia aquatilis]|uniref:Phenol hydroxylase n=1 Tax=Zavarzinia aquatilis TaxID=2211142 RepID=A0A317DXS0_9PROT|nr:phenol hydroxylase subunit [Zavarzinia aquatilis]PWR19527.1 phenol hydroxylase [Zavarzinia aquatilis]